MASDLRVLYLIHRCRLQTSIDITYNINLKQIMPMTIFGIPHSCQLFLFVFVFKTKAAEILHWTINQKFRFTQIIFINFTFLAKKCERFKEFESETNESINLKGLQKDCLILCIFKIPYVFAVIFLSCFMIAFQRYFHAR